MPGKRLSVADLPYLLNMALNFAIIESTEPYAKRLGQTQEETPYSPNKGQVSICTTVLPKLSFQIKKSITSSGIAEQMFLFDVDSKNCETPSLMHFFVFDMG